MNAQAGEPKYWAFISYSHRDAGVASTLQRALETYRLPKRLAGTTTSAGVVPAYLKPVFRDRDEMQAGADLKATVREALAQSRYLVVVCSPDAACSPWVNQEIVEFKKLHGENRVLALIASGEPFASNMPGREDEECFPPALRFALAADGRPEGEPLEPIAADLRPQGDGKRLATLKLIAGMVGVGVDELVRRDAQRRARRLAYVASGAVAGMAVMVVLTVLAVQSRIEAQRQRSQAEDLIEFMLGDLRKKLDPVGRLDVLDSLGEKAIEYYEKQDPDKLDANALGRRSRALHLIGEMRDKRGQLGGAFNAFSSAADTTAKLLSRAPNDGQRVFDHAQSVYWVGYIAWRRGNAQEAELEFLKYRELANELARIDPKNLDWQLETNYATQNLGVVQLDRRRLLEALASFNESSDVLTRLLPNRPELFLDLAEIQGWIAKTLDAAGHYNEAIAMQQKRLELLRSNSDSKKDRRVQQQIANANYELGRLNLEIGMPTAAERYEILALDISNGLVTSDAANTFWRSFSCQALSSLAETEFALGKRESARRHIDLAMEQLNRLIASDSSALNWQVRLKGHALTLTTRIALFERRPPPIGNLEAYLANVGRLKALGKQLNAEELTVVAGVELALGDALAEVDRRKDSAEHWANAARIVEPLTIDQNLPAITLLARADQRLERRDEALKLKSRVENSSYRHPAFADFANELALSRGVASSIKNQGELK